MGKFFDMDSTFMQFLNRVGDLMILNIIIVLCCIPVITIGPAYTAMHYVLLKIVRGEEGYLVKGFFKSFARNFKQAVILWILMLLVAAVYVGDAVIFAYSGIAFPKALVIAVAVIGILLLMISLYVFPLLARFDNTIKNTLRNAMLLAFGHLPQTLLMLLVYVLPFVICYFVPYCFIFVLMFGLSVPAYCAARLYSGIFKKFEPEVQETSDMDFTINVKRGEEEKNE